MQNFLYLYTGGNLMKTLRQTLAVTALSLVLAVSAFAGQIDSMGVVSPPTPPPGETQSPPTSITTTVILTILSLIR